jgi:hypothetical protein
MKWAKKRYEFAFLPTEAKRFRIVRSRELVPIYRVTTDSVFDFFIFEEHSRQQGKVQ